jgi:hypothetical protein
MFLSSSSRGEGAIGTRGALPRLRGRGKQGRWSGRLIVVQRSNVWRMRAQTLRYSRERDAVGVMMFPCLPRPRKRGSAPRVPTAIHPDDQDENEAPDEHKANHPGNAPTYRARGRIKSPWRCCSMAWPIQPATRPRAKIVKGELAGRSKARATAANAKSIVAGLRST